MSEPTEMTSILNRPEVKEAMKTVIARVTERIERGEAPPLRRAPTRKDQFPKVLCLDQNKWIDLARAHYGRADGQRFRPALEAVRTAIDSGRLVVPILGANLLEASEPRDEERRLRICRFMVDLSQNHSMVNSTPVLKEELSRSVLTEYLGEDCGPYPRHNIVRWGIFSAIGKEPPWGPDPLSQVMYEPEIGVLFLAYATGRDGVAKGRKLDQKAAGVALKARQDLGAGEARWLAELSNLFASGTTAETLNQLLDAHGVERDAFHSWLAGNLKVFAASVPNIDVSTNLLLTRDKNPGHKTHHNDLKDLAFLEVAIPYGNIVVTENSWTHLANAAGLSTKYQTKTMANVAGLPAVLQELGCLD